MIPNLRLIVWGVALAATLAVGIYAKLIYNKAQRVPDLEQRIEKLTDLIQRAAKENQEALQREHEIQRKLAAAYAGNADLARRLRLAYAASLPKTSPFAPEPVGTPGTGSGPDPLDAAVAGIIGACKADSIRLGEWQRYYESIPAELK